LPCMHNAVIAYYHESNRNCLNGNVQVRSNDDNEEERDNVESQSSARLNWQG
jgi:hypothetical protein